MFHQGATRAVTETGNSLLKVLYFIKNYLVTVILAVAFFTHFFLPKRELDIVDIKSKINEVEKKISEGQHDLINSVSLLSDGDINEQELISRESKFQKEQRNLNIHLDQLNEKFSALDNYYKNRYFNYPSRRSLMWSLGLGIIISILSLRYMQKIFEINTLQKETNQSTDINKKWADTLESFIGAIIGGYFFAWILDPVDRLDLPYVWYITLTVLLGVVGAFLGYFYTKSRHNKILVLKEKVSFLQKTVESLFKLHKAKK